MEIERKFRVQTLPPLKNHAVFHIRQAYISARPTIRIREIITQQNREYILTIKGHGSIAREEYELMISQVEFTDLLKKCEGIVLSKDRYKIPIENNLIAELDVYHGEFDGLYTVEVEFQNLSDADAFQPPDWFGKDISEDPHFKNSYLCLEWAKNKDRLI